MSHNLNTSNGTLYTTNYAYSGSGTLLSATIADGRPRTVTYTSDLNGQTIRRDENDNNTAAGDPDETWYRFNGKQMGYVGNDGTLDTDYQTSITNRRKASGTGAFRFGAPDPTHHDEFAPSLSSLTSYDQGSASGGYVVRGGETLASIAADLWGDPSLWYKLAEANGLSAQSALQRGPARGAPVANEASAASRDT